MEFNLKSILKNAGAFIALIIGPGFATGQEILQFFSSYGYASYGVVAINLVGFLFLGQALLIRGYEHREVEQFDHFKFFCGNKLGIFYSYLIPFLLIALVVVMVSAAGSILDRFVGNNYMGCAIVVILVPLVNLIRFNTHKRILTATSSIIVGFILLIGTITVFSGFPHITGITGYEKLESPRFVPHWIISAAVYVSFCFLFCSIFFTKLGQSSENKNDAKWGSIVAVIAIVVAMVIVNTAILLNAGEIANAREIDNEKIPMLYLAKSISYPLSIIASFVFLLGVLASSSGLIRSFMYSPVCMHHFPEGTKKNKILLLVISILIFGCALFPFDKLVGIVVPFIGYMGMIFVGCVIYKSLKSVI